MTKFRAEFPNFMQNLETSFGNTWLTRIVQNIELRWPVKQQLEQQ